MLLRSACWTRLQVPPLASRPPPAIVRKQGRLTPRMWLARGRQPRKTARQWFVGGTSKESSCHTSSDDASVSYSSCAQIPRCSRKHLRCRTCDSYR
jgi:hypothetical protein